MHNSPTLPHIDLPHFQERFDAIVEARRNNQKSSYMVYSILEDLRCTDFISSRWLVTDDEPGVARLIFEVLKLLLDHRGGTTDLDVSTALHGVLEHDRWRYCINDPDCCFALVGTIIQVSENFAISAFQEIPAATSHDDWPFPEHKKITAEMFANGDPETLESFCNAAFGSAWWQLVDPVNTHGSVIDMVVGTRPPLVNFAAQTSAVSLPTLACDGGTL
jgi:hypothetical protein